MIPIVQQQAVLYLINAAIADKQESSEQPFEWETGDLERERDKLYLREMMQKYKKLINKVGKLSPLPFEDDLIEEATRCWLYGFYRAAIVLAAAAVERTLKHVTGIERLTTYEELVESAVSCGKLSEGETLQAKEVFKNRNNVAHKAWAPEALEAETILGWARGVVGALK